MLFKKKKQVIIEGLFCDAVDYHYYNMTWTDSLIGCLLGFSGFFLVSYTLYSNIIISMISAIFGLHFGWKYYKKYLFNKREKEMMLQFKESLQLLSNAYSSGLNMVDSFSSVYEDLARQFKEDAYLTQEFLIIIQGLYNGNTIEDLLRNLSDRSTLEDIHNFTETFTIAYRRGGDLKKLISETKDIIATKIDETIDAKTVIHGSESQVYILLIMPFIIVFMMQGMGLSSSVLTPTTFITKTIALILFIFAFLLAKKISKIEV